MKTARLYTRQDERSLAEIEKTQRFSNKIAYVKEGFGDISGYILGCYRYFVEEAAKRIPKPEGVELPVWCAISKDNCFHPIKGNIVYVLDVPENEIIYFDGAKWDYVLNHHYVPRNMEDNENYEKRLKEKGIENSFEFFEGKYKNLFPEEKSIIMESWQRIFEIDDWNIYHVQANIWQIKKEWIYRIVREGEVIP